MSLPRILLAALTSAWCLAPASGGERDQQKKPPERQPESADFRELRKLMPPELMGLTRRNLEGEMAANEWAARTSVTAEYVREATKDAGPAGPEPDGPRIEVQYMDHGTSPGVTEAAAWAKAEVDRDDGNVSRRTRKVAGFPAIETYDRGSQSGTLQVFVAGRVMVLVLSHDVPADQFRKVGDALPLAKVAELVK